jgi:hypothetical protein
MGLGRAVKVMSLALAVGVSLAWATAPGSAPGADAVPAASVVSAPEGDPGAADSAAAARDSVEVREPLVPAIADSASVGGPPAAAPGDSSAADTSLVAAGPDSVPPRVSHPWAHTGILLKVPFQFFQPWTLRSAPGRDGLRVSSAALPATQPTGVPFERRMLLDLSGGTVSLTTRAGATTAYVSYAAPLAEYEDVVGTVSLRQAWGSTVLRELRATETAASRGLLDIDIPMPLPEPIVRAIGSGANLKVRGSERITFGGQTSYVVDALDLESGPPSRWPQLDMEQRLTVNLEGTIGDKIHVYVDHRSGGETFGAGKANQIRVRYEGEEDEIVQGIELGEVNLSLPGTEFVSYSGSQEGLFGAKMTAKIGKLDLVGIASKEEGKSSGANFTGTSEADSVTINDVSYKAGTYYAVDPAVLKYSNVALQSLRVYVDDRNGANDIQTGASPGRAYLDAPVGSVPPSQGPSQRGMFDQLVELEDYLVDYQTGIVEFLDPVSLSQVVAVSFARLDGSAVGGSDGDTLRLQLISKDDRVVGTAWEPIRRYELKNVYDLGAEDIPEDGFALEIRKRTPSGEILDNQDGVPYVQILGLDTHGLGGDPNPDGIVDLEWIDFEKGYLFFPHFTPFCPGYDTTGFYYAPGGEPAPPYVADELNPQNCAVYSKEVFQPDDDIYFLVATYDRPRTTFYLGQMNIIENSEVVRLNGVALSRGVDYTIYYPAGQLTLLSEEAKQPDARVTVDYDYQPFGIGGEKTLLGARGVYNWSENVKLGTTWMYQSKGTPEDRPRLGEEPSRTIVGDVNLSADFAPELLTSIADAIPFIDTDVPSKLSISAEAALCIPEPNTKGFVTVDDMEGVENVNMLGVTRRMWTHSSVPSTPGVVASDRMPINWYNPDRKVREGDLHPELTGQEADDIHTVLEVSYRDTSEASSWAGVMRLLSKTGNDYSRDEFVELWVNDNGYREGRVFVDLGTLNEDFYPLAAPNGELDSEDTDRNGFDADEDTGLDGVFGVDADRVPGDDQNDDYSFTYGSEDYRKINGTERNERLDTEDLNGNWYLDTEEKYWEVEVDLSDTTYVVEDNSAVEAENHWRLYRVPLDAALPVNGMTDWAVIKSARVWFQDLRQSGDPLMIGSMDIVGNQWEVEAIRDTAGVVVPESQLGSMSFRVTSKNTKEDPDYVPPFAVDVNEETGIAEREQSLVLLFDNLEPGYSGAARKVFYSDDNYTGYESLELYVHGNDGIDPGSLLFVRIGADTANYYEYSFEVSPGWRQREGTDANRLTLSLASLTDLKLPPYDGLDIAQVPGDTAAMSHELFRRVGWPSFSRVRRLEVGVRNGNAGALGDEVSGEIWIDDIRLSDVRKDIGLAERASVQIKMADLAEANLDVRFVDGDFHSLKQTGGSGQDNMSYNLTSTVNADRFVSGLGIAVPVNVVWKRSVSRPTFSTGSDMILDAQQSDRERTENLERSLAVSLSRKRQSPDFWTHLLADGLSLRASVSGSERLAPTKIDTATTLRGRLSYRYSTERQGVRVFRNTQVYFKPTSFRFNAETQLSHGLSYDVAESGVRTLRTDTHDRKLDVDAGIDFQLLDNLSTSHTVSARRDLTAANRPWAKLNIGTETQRQYSNSMSFNPKFGSWLSPEYSFSSTYTDNHGDEVRGTGDPYGVHDVRAQTSHDVSASFDMKKLVGTAPAAAPARPAPRVAPRGEGGEGAGETPEETRRPGQTDGPERSQPQEPGSPEQPGEQGPQLPEPTSEGGPELRRLLDPVLTFVRNMDAVEGRYSVRWSSRYDSVLPEEIPGWQYRLGLSAGEGADDRTAERSLDLGTGVKITDDIRIKGDYKRSLGGRWYKSSLSDSIDLTTRTESMTETRKASLSWGGIERIGPLKGIFTNVRARSGLELKKSYSGPLSSPTARGDGLALSPVVSVETTFRNGLTGSLSWDRKRARSYSLAGTGSVTEEMTGSTSLSLKYRFSAPQGLKLPFFGQKLRFQSNMDCSLTLKTSSRLSRTALDEAGLVIADPTSAVKDFSVTGDATYSFSRSVSGGLQVSFAQSRDEKRDQVRRTIGVHLTAEFKF